jgi:hypothetical protein
MRSILLGASVALVMSGSVSARNLGGTVRDVSEMLDGAGVGGSCFGSSRSTSDSDIGFWR